VHGSTSGRWWFARILADMGESPPMGATRTTAAVQRFLDDLRTRPEEISDSKVVRDLLERSATRLHQLGSWMIRRRHPRLAMFGAAALPVLTFTNAVQDLRSTRGAPAEPGAPCIQSIATHMFQGARS
jgi:hypothetical protein